MNQKTSKPDLANKKDSEIERPDNEPEFLQDFDYTGIPEDGTDIYKTVNEAFTKGDWSKVDSDIRDKYLPYRSDTFSGNGLHPG